MKMTLNRRQALTIGAGAVAVAALGQSITPAFAKNDYEDVIKQFTGGKAPTEGKVKLDLPEIAENGNTVPITVTVESPMTEQSYVTDVIVRGRRESARRHRDLPFLAAERRCRGQYPHPSRQHAEHHRRRQNE